VYWFDLRSKRSDRVAAFVSSAIDLSRLTVQSQAEISLFPLD